MNIPPGEIFIVLFAIFLLVCVIVSSKNWSAVKKEANVLEKEVANEAPVIEATVEANLPAIEQVSEEALKDIEQGIDRIHHTHKA